MTKDEVLEYLERLRRSKVHLVKPANTEFMKKLDQEIYQGISNDSEKGANNGDNGPGWILSF